MKNNYKKWEILLIHWVDSYHQGGWKPSNEQIEEMDDNWLEHDTVGFFIHETPHQIAVIQSFSRPFVDDMENRSTDALMAIPKVAIKKIRKLNVKV